VIGTAAALAAGLCGGPQPWFGLDRQDLGDAGRVVGEHEPVPGADLDHPSGEPSDEGAAVLGAAGAVHRHADALVEAGEYRVGDRGHTAPQGGVPVRHTACRGVSASERGFRLHGGVATLVRQLPGMGRCRGGDGT
jgi:hypothetical protein